MSYFFLFFPLERVVVAGGLLVAILLIGFGVHFLDGGSAKRHDGRFLVKASIGSHAAALGLFLKISVLLYGVVYPDRSVSLMEGALAAAVFALWGWIYYQKCCHAFSFDVNDVVLVTTFGRSQRFLWEDLEEFSVVNDHINIGFVDGRKLSIPGWMKGANQLHHFLASSLLRSRFVDPLDDLEVMDSDPWQRLIGRNIVIIVYYIDENLEIAGDSILEGRIQHIGEEELRIALNDDGYRHLLSIPKGAEMLFHPEGPSNDAGCTDNELCHVPGVVATLYSMDLRWRPSIEMIGRVRPCSSPN